MADRVDGYEVVVAKAFENRFLLDQIPDFYKRLQDSYDENFYRQEVLGTYLNMTGGLVYGVVLREKSTCRGTQARSPFTAAVDAGFQRGPHELADRADRRREGTSAG